MFAQLGVVLEVVDYASDAIVFSRVLDHGAKNEATASLVVWYAICLVQTCWHLRIDCTGTPRSSA